MQVDLPVPSVVFGIVQPVACQVLAEACSVACKQGHSGPPLNRWSLRIIENPVGIRRVDATTHFLRPVLGPRFQAHSASGSHLHNLQPTARLSPASRRSEAGSLHTGAAGLAEVGLRDAISKPRGEKHGAPRSPMAAVLELA